MIHVKIPAILRLATLLWCAVSSSLQACADSGATTSNHFPMITASGSHIASIFEGRIPNDYVKTFRYKAQVNPGNRRDRRDQSSSGEPARWTYDVFFTLK